ncbi:MAG: hypothetical protein JEZ14_23050 [Marinilabiliaceae bacterium]|nr:hypothetical protein [Marinilabiliaceae bacterium]
MDKLTLENRRDFPMTTNVLAFMQAAYGMLEQLSALGGDNYIVSGCTVTGSSVSAGYMVLKGILMPFTGGSVTTNVRIVKTVAPVTVDTGTREQVSYHAEFGTSANPDENVAWADISPMVNLQQKVNAVAGHRLMTDAEGTKLAGIPANANNYNHPASHPMNMIDGLIDALAGKVAAEAGKRLMTDAEGTKLAGIAVNANNYSHPASHSMSLIDGLPEALQATKPTRSSQTNVGGPGVGSGALLNVNANTISILTTSAASDVIYLPNAADNPSLFAGQQLTVKAKLGSTVALYIESTNTDLGGVIQLSVKHAASFVWTGTDWEFTHYQTAF